MSEDAMRGRAAFGYLVLARDDRRLAGEAEERTLYRLSNIADEQGRIKAINQARLASARFLAEHPEQAVEDGNKALGMAEHVMSAIVRATLRELLADSETYADIPSVVEFRDRLRATIARLN